MPIDKSTGGRLYHLTNLMVSSTCFMDALILTPGGMKKSEIEKMEEWHDRSSGKKLRKTVRFVKEGESNKKVNRR